MKKITLLFLLLIVSVTYAQQFTSKENARRGITTPAQTTTTVNHSQSRNVRNVTIFSESFDASLGSWTTNDADGDGNNWEQIAYQNYAHSGAGYAKSASWTQADGPLTPDNWLISPAIDLTAATGTIFLEWYVRAIDQTWPAEVYRVLVSTGGTATADFTEIYPDETVQPHGPDGNEYFKRTLNISSYIGQTIHIAFEHHNCTDMFQLAIDDVSVYQNDTVDAGLTAFVAPNNDSGCGLTNAEDVTVTVFNYGGFAITDFDISYTINGGTPVTENVTGVNIAPGTSYDYTFTAKADLSTLGYYTLESTINLTGDSDATNNTVTTEVANGDANLQIEVQTDNIGGQSWTLTNSAGDVVAQHGAYQWNITETTTVCLIDNDCYTFSWLSATGSSNTVTLTYNGTQIDQTTATGNYNVYAIGGNCSAVDLKLDSLDIPAIVANGANVDIKGDIKNVGTNAITSFDVVYVVDGTASSTYTVSGVNVTTGQTYTFTHDVPYVAAVGSHDIEVTISNVNGGTPAETNLMNNTIIHSIVVASNSTQKLPLFEEFTSSTCAPCASFNANSFNTAFLTSNAGHFSLIKYQMNWPGSGDIYYTAEGGVRRAYYDVTGVPTLFLEGSVGPGYTANPNTIQPSLDAAYAAPAFIAMDAVHTIDETNKMVYVRVNISPYLTGNYKLHCAVVEKTTTGNVGSNGETSFTNVMMKMVPDADGTAVSLADNQNLTVNLQASLNGTHIEEYSDLEVIVFLQDDSNKNVLQSAISVEDTGNAIEDVVFDGLSIYPTPATNYIHIANAEGMQITIYNLNGSVLFQKDNLLKQNTLTLPQLANGVYLAKFTKNGQTAVRKLIISK